MVVLFVILTFAAFIAADYLLNRAKYQVEIPAAEPEQATARTFEPVTVNGVKMLPGLRYHPGHAWASVEGPAVARIGLDDFGARLLGAVQSVELPPVGRWLRQGERAFTVRVEGRTAEIVSPVEGEVTQINASLLRSPDTLRQDPYGTGWVVVLRSPDLATTLRNLLSGSLALRWMEDSVARLRAMFAPAAIAMAQDAGPLRPGIASEADDARWREAIREFLLNEPR